MPQILENWHHPYHRELLEGQGLAKAKDLYKWQINPADRGELLPLIEELAERLEPEHGIRLRRMGTRTFTDDVRAFMNIYNESWSHNWGFVPLTDNEVTAIAKELKPILDEGVHRRRRDARRRSGRRLADAPRLARCSPSSTAGCFRSVGQRRSWRSARSPISACSRSASTAGSHGPRRAGSSKSTSR
jgi:hypothetical protein